MRTRVCLFSLTVALIGLCDATSNRPSAQSAGAPTAAFGCPAGVVTRTTFVDGHSIEATWQGADPTDPVVCRVLANGQVRRFLYGVTQVPLLSGEDDARRVLAHVFAGSTTEECYETKQSTGGANVSYYYGKECWRQVGQSAIVVNGKTVAAIVIQETYDGLAGNAYAGDWTFYYDPGAHLIIKGDTVTRRGRSSVGWTRAVIG